MSFSQDDVKINGWAIECRINAEDPEADFAPAPGKVRGYRSPGGTGIRVDSGVYASYTIPTFYDSMISKLIAWGKDRNEAIARMKRALYEYIITGVKTNLDFHKTIMDNPRFVAGEIDTHFIEKEKTLFDDLKAISAREMPLAGQVDIRPGQGQKGRPDRGRPPPPPLFRNPVLRKAPADICSSIVA